MYNDQLLYKVVFFECFLKISLRKEKIALNYFLYNNHTYIPKIMCTYWGITYKNIKFHKGIFVNFH